MPLMEISVVPLGTGSPSVSRHVAACVRLIKGRRNIKYALTAMGTIIEADSTAALFNLAAQMHKAVLRGKIKRVVTTIKIDERTDKRMTMQGKVDTVMKKLR